MEKLKTFWTEITEKNILLPKRTGLVLVPEYYIAIVLFLYPLFFSEDRILLVFNQKTFIFCVLTICAALCCIGLYGRKTFPVKICLSWADILLAVAVIVLVIWAFVKIFHSDMSYEQEAFLWCLIASFFLLKVFGRREGSYLNLFLFSAIFICIDSIVYILSGTDFFLGVSAMFEPPQDASSYFLLASCTASVLYCNEKRKRWGKFYLLASLIGYIALLLHKDIVSACLLGLFLLCIPIAFSPAISLVRQNLFLCFAFLFIMSSTPLLQYIIDGISQNEQYDLSYSVYIDLFLASAGVCICQYWEKVPKDRDPDRVLMKRFQKWYRRAAAFVLFILTAVVLTGNRMEGITDRFGIKTLKVFAASMQSSISSAESFYQQLLENYGVVGCFLWGFLSVLFLEKIIKAWRNADIVRKQYLSLSVLFLVQTLFYRLQPVNTPAFVVLLALALSEKKTDISIAEKPDAQRLSHQDQAMHEKGDL